MCVYAYILDTVLFVLNNTRSCRSAITIFPHRTNDGGEFRVWNPQLIMYAGYRQADGTIIGDPKSAEFTEVRQYVLESVRYTKSSIAYHICKCCCS